MQNSIFLKFLVFVICISTFSMSAQSLKKHKWKHRVIIVKTLASDSDKFEEQLSEFKISSDELRERKLVLYTINQNEFSFTDYTYPSLNYLGESITADIKQKLTAEEGFEFILIGLDGGVKLRKNDVVSREELFSIIDAMPMRRNEMRN